MLIVPSVYAQNTTSAPNLGQSTGRELRAQGTKNFKMKGEFGQKAGNFANLTLEEQKQKITDGISMSIENLNKRLQNMEENEFLTEDLKNQLQALITNHINNLPSYKEKVQAATDEDALKAVLEEMHADAQAMRDFMEENRPTKEQMEEHWNSLSLDEKKAKMLENLKDKQTKLSERQAELTQTIQKVTDAATNEDLAAIRDEMGAPMGMKMGRLGQGQGLGNPFPMGHPKMGNSPIDLE